MFWSKKKKTGLPDLPMPQVVTPKKERKEEIEALPSFPTTLSKKESRQELIKKAVEPEEPAFPTTNEKPIKMTEEVPDLEGLPELPEYKEKLLPSLPAIPKKELRTKTREVEEWKPSKIHPKKIIEKKPIFVKLDKFNEAKESLESVKEKLSEIDDLLKTLKDVKSKEEHELLEWGKQMEELKSRLESLTADVFEDVER